MRVLVTGDRNWRNAPVVMDALDQGIEMPRGRTHEEITIVHGDARGADTYAEVCAQLLMLHTDPHPAMWERDGRGAGPIRNQQMLDSGVDYVLGFHNDIRSSRGTRDMLRRCARAGIPGRLFTETGEVENWEEVVNE